MLYVLPREREILNVATAILLHCHILKNIAVQLYCNCYIFDIGKREILNVAFDVFLNWKSKAVAINVNILLEIKARRAVLIS